MKKGKQNDIRAEYGREDLGPGIRAKYLDDYRRGTNLVLLTPEVAKAVPTEEAVNSALQSLIDIARRSTRQ